jgi:hypothetical protein
VRQLDKPWYDGRPDGLRDTLTALENALTATRGVDCSYLRAYYQTPVDASAVSISDVLAPAEATARLRQARERESLLRSVIDSYAAMVVQVPAIDVSTSGGTWAQRRSAELLGAFCDGVFHANDMESLAWRCVVDSCLTRVAAVRIEADTGKAIRITRILPHQIVYSTVEGADPANLFTRTPTPRSELRLRYPALAGAIDKAEEYRPEPMLAGLDGWSPEIGGDLVLLDEGWHRADPGDPESGRYVAAIGDLVLADDVWRHEWSPIVPLRFDWSYSNYGGTPAADTLAGYQVQLDEFGEMVRTQFRIGSRMRVLVDREAGVENTQLNTEDGQRVDHNPGKPPVFSGGAAPHPELLQREQQIVERAFSFMGLSYQASKGERSPGLSSGKAIREDAAIGQNRQVLRMRQVQNWLVRIAETVIRVADATYDKDHDAVVTAPGSRYLSRVYWSDIDYDEDLFTVQVDAINALSRHPSARVDEVLDLVEHKIIDERQGLKAIGYKDLQGVRDAAFAAEDYAERLIDLALGGDYRTPDPYAGPRGLQLVVDRGRERYLVESVEREPSDHLGLLRDLIEAATSTLAGLQAPAPANQQTDIAPAPAAPAPAAEAGPPAALPETATLPG